MRANKILFSLLSLPRDEARSIITQWESAALKEDDSLMEVLNVHGYEHVNAVPGQVYVDDGEPRLITWVRGRAYALPADEHRRLREQAIADALREEKEAKARVQQVAPRPGESLAAVLCPVDHATMAKSPVCPKCSKGRAGYKLLLTCTICGHEVYL